MEMKVPANLTTGIWTIEIKNETVKELRNFNDETIRYTYKLLCLKNVELYTHGNECPKKKNLDKDLHIFLTKSRDI